MGKASGHFFGVRFSPTSEGKEADHQRLCLPQSFKVMAIRLTSQSSFGANLAHHAGKSYSFPHRDKKIFTHSTLFVSHETNNSEEDCNES